MAPDTALLSYHSGFLLHQILLGFMVTPISSLVLAVALSVPNTTATMMTMTTMVVTMMVTFYAFFHSFIHSAGISTLPGPGLLGLGHTCSLSLAVSTL